MSEFIPADLLKIATKAAMGLIPGGSIAAEIFDCFLTRYQEKGIEFITLSLNDAYTEASRTGLTIEDLQSNETLRRTLIAATRAADATASDEKRKRLKNAVVNAAVVPGTWQQDEARLLRLLEVCNETHIRLLNGIAKSDGPIMERQPSRIGEPEEKALARYESYRIALSDLTLLNTEGLIWRSPDKGVTSGPQDPYRDLDHELSRYVDGLGHPVEDCRLTRLGKTFLDFITRE